VQIASKRTEAEEEIIEHCNTALGRPGDERCNDEKKRERKSDDLHIAPLRCSPCGDEPVCRQDRVHYDHEGRREDVDCGKVRESCSIGCKRLLREAYKHSREYASQYYPLGTAVRGGGLAIQPDCLSRKHSMLSRE